MHPVSHNFGLTSWVSALIMGNGVTAEGSMVEFCRKIWSEEQGQDIAEYAVMLAVILVLVVGTIRLIGGNANNVFSSTASSITP
jgi:Flp pilus assembly pilin Flp